MKTIKHLRRITSEATRSHTVANIVTNAENEMTAIELEDGFKLVGIVGAGMQLDPSDHTKIVLRISMHGPIRVNGKPPAEAFQKKLEATPAVVTRDTRLVGPDGKMLS